MGHLMRCFALSEELINRKNICYFISNIDNEILCKNIEKSNIILKKVSTFPDEKDDINLLINFSKKNEIDWIITDHYYIDIEYVKKLKEKKLKILSIDDNSNIHYYSDIVVNQNIGAKNFLYSAEKYTKFLLGPKYAILRDNFLKKPCRIIKKEVKNILITLGGIDKENVTMKILELLKILDCNIKINVVIGPLNPHYNSIKKNISEYNCSIHLYNSPEKMEDIYYKSDIAISAGGTSCYEMAYFGIPNIIISIADNQINSSKELHNKIVSIYLGDKNEIKSSDLVKKINELINDYDLRLKMSNNGKKFVDGNGKKRIVDFMERL
jgi:UDP-2,4-diacetamido-2,4,6-trideoxy-beta-L-altropyranose hydrolase